MRSWEVRTADDFDRIFAALNKERPDGLYVLLAGSLMRSNVNRITNFALKNMFASMYDETSALEVGGLMSYGANVAHSYQRAAYFVDRILKGAKPADLPEQPTKFEFVIKLRTAKQIGLTIPPDLLARATKIIR